MKGFIIYPDYLIVEERAYVQLYGRLENGESFVTLHHFQPYFYIKADDLDIAHDLSTAFLTEKTSFTDKDGNPVIKIILDLPADVPKLRRLFDDAQIKCYEADIKFPYRFLMDHDLKGGVDIDGHYEPSERVDRVYKEPDIKPAPDYFPKNLRILSFDIESGKTETDDSLYCIGLVCDGTKKVFINTTENVEGAISCASEAETIERFFDEIITLDPDIITGWNVIDFDLNYLHAKSKRHKIPFCLGRSEDKCKLRVEDNYMLSSKADFPGRVVLDGIHLLEGSFIKLDDYKLNTAAHTILGDTKLVTATGLDKYKEIDTLWQKNKKKLVAYNLKDAELVTRIIEKTKVLELTIERSILTGMPPDRVNASIASLDSLYIREAHKRNLVVPTGHYAERGERIQGGYVRESEPGIYDYILILDFKSLYPSIIKTFNIDPLSYVENADGKNLIEAPNGAHFKNQDGILPSLITSLWKARDKARKDKNELARHAIKIHMNSMFGVLANPSCRFYDLNIANAITHFSHHIIKLTSEQIEKKGYKVIYNDTDSAFVISNAKTLAEAEALGKKLATEINTFYKTYTKKNYNRENALELEFSKCYIKCIMPRLRKEEAGAKKRYAGLLMKDGKETIEFTGLEAVRGDWTQLAKKFQYELLDRIFHSKEVTAFVKQFIQDIRKGKYDNLLVYKKAIRKDLKAYTATTPPHVKAARQLEVLDGAIIEYVITEAGPEPIQKTTHKLDYDHYIEKQIQPLADSVLGFFNTNFEAILKGNKQVSLFDY